MAINIFPRVDVTGSNRWSPLRRGHWSTQGLFLCLPCGQGSVVSVSPVTRVGLAFGTSGGAADGRRYADPNDFDELVPSSEIGSLPTQRATVLCVRRCADTSNRSSSLFGLRDSDTPSRLTTHCPWSDGNVYWDFGGASGANRISAAITKTTNVEAWAFVAGAAGSAFYRDGVQLASQSTSITRSTVNVVAFTLNHAGADGDLQDVLFFAVLDAEWLPAQVAEWSVNPWLMFGTASVLAEAPAVPASAARSFAVFLG